ncbi:transcriptional regulator, partial [Vibrio parahaemolyticus]
FSQMRYESLIKTVLKLSCEMLIERIEEEINQ